MGRTTASGMQNPVKYALAWVMDSIQCTINNNRAMYETKFGPIYISGNRPVYVSYHPSSQGLVCGLLSRHSHNNPTTAESPNMPGPTTPSVAEKAHEQSGTSKDNDDLSEHPKDLITQLPNEIWLDIADMLPADSLAALAFSDPTLLSAFRRT